MFRSGWSRPEERPGRAYPAGVDFGTVGFIIFVAFWVFILRARTRAARASRVSRGRRDVMPQPPRPLTIVGIEDRETAVGALAAITGASRSEALASLANLPTTIAVPADSFSAALEIFAESGVAYATGTLGTSARSPAPTPPADLRSGVPAPPPLTRRPPARSDRGEFRSPTSPADDPSTPPESGYDTQPDTHQKEADNPMPPEPVYTPQPDTNQREADNPGPFEPAPVDRDLADEDVTPLAVEPVWVEMDVETTPAEVLEAMANPERRVAERNLRRLSMNGVRDADVALGILLADWGRPGEAEGLFLSRAQDHPVAANNLGVLHEADDRLSAARANYGHAAELGSAAGAANLARLEE